MDFRNQTRCAVGEWKKRGVETKFVQKIEDHSIGFIGCAGAIGDTDIKSNLLICAICFALQTESTQWNES